MSELLAGTIAGALLAVALFFGLSDERGDVPPSVVEAVAGANTVMEWADCAEDHNALKNGTVWLTEDDAQAALDAMLKPLREYAGASQ